MSVTTVVDPEPMLRILTTRQERHGRKPENREETYIGMKKT